MSSAQSVAQRRQAPILLDSNYFCVSRPDLSDDLRWGEAQNQALNKEKFKTLMRIELHKSVPFQAAYKDSILWKAVHLVIMVLRLSIFPDSYNVIYSKLRRRIHPLTFSLSCRFVFPKQTKTVSEWAILSLPPPAIIPFNEFSYLMPIVLVLVPWNSSKFYRTELNKWYIYLTVCLHQNPGI